MKKPIENYVNNKINLNESLTISGLVVFFGLDAVISTFYALNLFLKRIATTQDVIRELEKRKYAISHKKLTQIIRTITKDNSVNVFIMNIDERMNAFNLGTSDIYLTKDLFELLTDDEIIAICLHEYGHYYYGHNSERYIKFGLTDFISCFVMIPFGIVSLGIGYLLWGVIIELLQEHGYNKVDRKIYKPQEYSADSYAKKRGYGKSLISALNKLEQYVYVEFKEQLCKKRGYNDERCEEEYDYMLTQYSEREPNSHPTTKDRIAVLQLKFLAKQMVAQINKGEAGLNSLIKSLDKNINKLEKGSKYEN